MLRKFHTIIGRKQGKISSPKILYEVSWSARLVMINQFLQKDVANKDPNHSSNNNLEVGSETTSQINTPKQVLIAKPKTTTSPKRNSRHSTGKFDRTRRTTMMKFLSSSLMRSQGKPIKS
jgi:hypothetical protein